MNKIQFSTPNTDAELKGFGIYAITNTENEKAYVGSVNAPTTLKGRGFYVKLS